MAITSPVFVIDDTGISAPTFPEILSWLQDQYRGIYGSDVNLDADTQDGQFLGIIASAFNDVNNSGIATYNSYSPTFAQGAGLSSVVKINGLKRLVPSNSTVVVDIVGTAGTIITNGVITDNLSLNTVWNLPATVTIPNTGTIEVTAICAAPGAITASANTIQNILTPQPGWQTVNNPSNAIPGAPVESDAALRRRQSMSTSNPAQGVRSGIEGSIANIQGVQRVVVYENDTNITDVNTLPPHSISPVVEGGDVFAVATAIALRKPPGTTTYGTTSSIIVDSRGLPAAINFYELVLVPITVVVNLTALTGYSAAIGDEILNQIIAWITALPIGYDSYLTKLEAATQVIGSDGFTYEVTSVLQARIGSPAAADVVIAFNEAATTNSALISINVT